jgi:hypothetical protein
MFPALRSLCYFTALGLATVVLIGPTLAVVGTLLPFALLGVLVWVFWRGVRRLAGRTRWDAVQARLAPAWVLPEVRQRAGHAIQEGLRRCPDLRPAIRTHFRGVRAGLLLRARALGHRLVETVSGGLLGGLAAWLAVGAADETVAVSALAGAVLGALLPGPQSRPTRELAAAK